MAAAKSDPVAAADQYRQAIALRDLAVRLYSARVLDRQAADADVAALNAMLRKYARSPELTAAGLGYVWGPADDEACVLGPMRRLVGLIAGFLASPDFGHVRMCEGQHCGWFFVDRTPTRRRRWCAMEGCGNRAKAQLHYRRHRVKAKPAIAGRGNSVR
jgi:predicted RNA-binding Zn ribbon-like protein